MKRCISCEAEVTGKYCAACGEKVLDEAALDWRRLVFAGNGVALRTLRSLFTRPGELAQAFVSGRRRPFLNPVRLYLLAFLAYELVKGLTSHGHPSFDLHDRVRIIDPTGVLDHLLDQHPAEFWNNPANEARLAQRAKWLSESGTFIISIFVALLQSLIFVRLGRKYLEHLALAINVTTFFLLCVAFGQGLMAALGMANSAAAEATLQTLLGFIALPTYWFLSIRRFYKVAPLWSGISVVVITGGTVLVAMVLNLLALAILIVTA